MLAERSKDRDHSPVVALLLRADRAAVENGLRAFVGPHADTYLRYYARLRATPAHRLRRGIAFWPVAWSWPVFLTWFVWHGWRKRWLDGAAAILVPLAGEAAFGLGGWVAGYLLVCGLAVPAYLHGALASVARIEAETSDPEGRRVRLMRAGGVSKLGAAAGFVALLATCVSWTLWRLPAIDDRLDAWGLLPPH